MHVTLHVISGPATGRQIHLQAGQVGRFGRTEWADFSFPDDKAMARVHFLLQCDPAGPRLRDLQSPSGIWLNDQPVTEAEVCSGDEIAAGTTRFLVEVDGESPMPAEGSDSIAVDDASDAGGPIKTAADICKSVELEDEARSLLTDDQTPQEFADLLAEQELFRDAVRFSAAWLTRRDSICWGCLCVREFFGKKLSAEDAAALQIAERWTAEPSEDLRREAEKAAEQNDYRTPAGWLNAAVFWSGGSLAPPENAPVPPPEHLTATAVTAALLLTAAQSPPLEVEAVLRNFLSMTDRLRAT